jgi:hypothetical protein
MPRVAEELRSWRFSDGRTELEARIRALCSRLEQPGAIETVAALVGDEQQPEVVRAALLCALMDASSPEAVDRLTSLMTGWAISLRQTNGIGPRSESGTRIRLVSRFLRLYRDEGWMTRGTAQHELLELLQHAMTSGTGPAIGAPAYELLALSPAEPSRKRRVAEAVVEAHSSALSHHPVVFQMLSEESLPPLRRILTTSSEFHFGAAAALAQLGDVTVVDYLQRRRKEFSPAASSGADQVGYFIWQIEVQQDTGSLVSFIASDADIAGKGRVWAILRTRQLGVRSNELRAAILEHARHVQPRELVSASGEVHRYWPGLEEVKTTGVALGVMSETDLPHIPLTIGR